MFKLFLLSALVASALAASIPYDTCVLDDGTTLPEPISFAIPECSGFPCNVAVNQAVTLLIGIDVPGPVTALPVRAQVSVEGYSFDFPLPNGDACAAIPTGCPQQGGNYLITFPTELTGVSAGVEVTVRVQIDDQDGNVIACGSVTTTFA